jgi:hypothetical protein
MWPQRSRAWKARPVPSSWPDATPMAQVGRTVDGPLLTVRDRQMPVLPARGGTAGEDQPRSSVAATVTSSTRG